MAEIPPKATHTSSPGAPTDTHHSQATTTHHRLALATGAAPQASQAPIAIHALLCTWKLTLASEKSSKSRFSLSSSCAGDKSTQAMRRSGLREHAVWCKRDANIDLELLLALCSQVLGVRDHRVNLMAFGALHSQDRPCKKGCFRKGASVGETNQQRQRLFDAPLGRPPRR